MKGGKLVKCSLVTENGRIEKIKFTGDFFMYPEEKIEELEKMLEGAECTREGIKARIAPFFDSVELMGASMEDFVEVVMVAMQKPFN